MTTVRARRTTTLLAAGALALALTGCGVGLDPQTYRGRTAPDAATAQVGGLALRDLAIAPPAAAEAELAAGTDAQLTLAVVNPGPDADVLTGVSSPASSSAKLVDGSGHDVASVNVPARGSIEPGDFGVVLVGLTNALRPGIYVDVTFTFANNGAQTVHVPVRVYDTPVPRDSYQPKPAAD